MRSAYSPAASAASELEHLFGADRVALRAERQQHEPTGSPPGRDSDDAAELRAGRVAEHRDAGRANTGATRRARRLSWLPAITTTRAPVSRSASSASQTTCWASGDGAADS